MTDKIEITTRLNTKMTLLSTTTPMTHDGLTFLIYLIGVIW